jgi:hypothetical protein
MGEKFVQNVFRDVLLAELPRDYELLQVCNEFLSKVITLEQVKHLREQEFGTVDIQTKFDGNLDCNLIGLILAITAARACGRCVLTDFLFLEFLQYLLNIGFN